jgi:4-amino-4-deoxy-L-arabinose transferase-like glycosyltransferase
MFRSLTITQSRRSAIIVCGLVLVVYILLAAGLVRTKLPWRDEAHFANAAYNLASTGRMMTTIIEPDDPFLRGIDRHTYWVPPLYPLLLAGWFKLSGFSLIRMRVFSTLWGIIALGAWYLIAIRLFRDRRAAQLIVALIAVDYFFIMLATIGRMDTMCATLGVSAYACYLHWRESHFGRAILASQALIAASGLTHPNGLLYFVGLLFLTIYLDRRRLHFRHLLMAALPYLVGGMAWGAYILQSPADFIAQFGGNINGYSGMIGHTRWTGMSQLLTGFVVEIKKRYLENFGFGWQSRGVAQLKILILIAYLGGIIGVLSNSKWRRQEGFRILLGWATISFLMMSILEGHKHAMYLAHITPILAAIFAAWVYANLSGARQTFTRLTFALGTAALFLFQVAGLAYLIKQDLYRQHYLPVVERIKSYGDPPNVIASAHLAFGVGFENLTDDIRLGYHSGKAPHVIAITPWDTMLLDAYFKTHEPQVYEFINRRLTKEYQLVYEYPEFWKIYLRAAR